MFSNVNSQQEKSLLSMPLRWETCVVVLVGAVALAMLLSLGARQWWVCELLCHFQLQYACLLLSATALLAWRKYWRSAALSTLLLCCVVLQLMPYLLPVKYVGGDGKPIRLMSFNIHSANQRYQEVLAMIRRTRPDIVLLLEVDPDWARELEALRADYPHGKGSVRRDNFGILLLSRMPFVEARLDYLGETARVPLVSARFREQDKDFAVIGVHTLPPVSSEYAAIRNEQLRLLPQWGDRLSRPETLVAGDLNVTPWSPYFGDITDRGWLRDARKGFGILTTWPSHFWLMRIPIDHCLVSDGIVVRNVHVEAACGSDHHALVVDFTLQATGK